MRGILSQLKQWFLELSKIMQIVDVVLLIVIIVVFIRFIRGSEDIPVVNQTTRSVKVAKVADLSNTDNNLPLLGMVTSTSEATVRAEVGGRLNRVYKKLGDTIVAGEIIAEFENSGERAAVLQAEGVYDSAKAARDIAKINSGTTLSSLTEAKTSALNIIGSSYVSMDDAIRVKTDGAYTNPRDANVRFAVAVPDANLTLSLEARRRTIEAMLITRESRNKMLNSNTDLVSELSAIQSEAQTIKSYLDDLATAYSKALPDNNYSQTAIDANKLNVSSARTSITNTISSISSSRSTLNASIGAQAVADKTTGTAVTNVTSADASVKQALGAYNGALSRLEKTIIRSPITGTLNSLSIQTGDFVSAFTVVAVVSNNKALEVVSYVNEDDAKRVQVGNEVLIDNQTKGVITRVAPAIDPITKKIEVRVGIIDKTSTLVNGQSVRIIVTKGKQSVSNTAGPIKIPLSSLKLTPNGAFVFTVSSTSSLVSIPVKEGAILGDEIQIISGLSGDETIVTDARGLKTNMVVTVKE